MSDDYLWDGSGEPDPEVRRLEEMLKTFRYEPGEADRSLSGDAAAQDDEAEGVRRRLQWRSTVRRRATMMAIAAVVLLGVIGLVGVPALRRVLSRGASGWEVVTLAGEPTVASARLGGTGTLPVGEWIETDAGSRAEVKVGLIGSAVIEPNTRVRLVKSAATEHRLGLERGTLHARIWAPPRLFYVETPSAVAVDLGCAYTITVDESGGSLLRVETGWVAYEAGGRESFVPAGALCTTRAGAGPGTPYYEDAPAQFIEALKGVDGGVAGGVAGGVRGGVHGGIIGGVSEGVRGGVAGGVAGGVKSGVSGGVTGGIQGEVRGVVAGGVAGGVRGGVDGGVAGGVAGGVNSGGTDRTTDSVRICTEGGVASPNASALRALLSSARKRDALTLWHLLSRIEGADRGRIYDRMAGLVPPPSGVTREGVLAGDLHMLDLWWDQLGLGVTSWWRLWKQPGPPHTG